MKRCIYSIILPPNGDVHCNVYSKSERSDGKFWAHFPECKKENCPFEHPELLEGAILKRDETHREIVGRR